MRNYNELKIKKVIQFFQSLPSDLITSIFDNLSTNRPLRRQLSKIKTMEDKISFAMSPPIRENFSTAAYITIKDNVDLILEKTKFEDIISAITDENKLFYAIFFFKWCY